MKILNCKECNKIFSYETVETEYCPECEQQYYEMIHIIREFLIAHPNSSAWDIYKGTRIDIKHVLRLIKDGKLARSISSKEYGSCKKCGKLIDEGIFCPNCKPKTIGYMRSVRREAENKMRHLE